jgi:ParB family chromosome partitioning protein
MNKRRLGKGLGAIFNISEISNDDNLDVSIKGKKEKNEGVVEVLLRKVKPNPKQPRKVFDQQKLAELADTIGTYGIIQPITVFQEDDHYILITGERRLKAAEMAGLETIPAIIRDYNPEEFMEITLVENLQREDLNPIEEALAFRELIEQFNLTQEKLAQRIGKSRSAITNSLRLLSLSEQVQDLIISGKLTAGQARPLLSINDQKIQFALALEIVNNNMSAREIEKLIKKYKRENLPENKDQQGTKNKTQEQLMLAEMEEKVRKTYGTRVTIKMGSKGGKIELTFYNNEDLERLLELLLKKEVS